MPRLGSVAGRSGRLRHRDRARGDVGGKEIRKSARFLSTVDLEKDEFDDDDAIHLKEGVDAAVHGINSDGRVASLNDLPFGECSAMMII